MDSKRRIDMLHKHDNEAILFAEIENNIIGCVLLNDYKWEAMIYHLAVLPEFQNQGIGGKLMKEAERILKDKGQEYITLLVSVKDKNLNKFYEKRGYKLWAALNDRRKKL